MASMPKMTNLLISGPRAGESFFMFETKINLLSRMIECVNDCDYWGWDAVLFYP